MNNEKIAYIYDVTESEAETYNNYLNINPKTYCCEHIVEPYITTNMKQFSIPIDFYIKYYVETDLGELSDYHMVTSIPDKLLLYANKYNDKQLICDNIYDDIIATEYIKNRPLSHLIILWPKNNMKKIANYINQFGIITIKKQLKLTSLGIKNLLCELYISQILQYDTGVERLNFIERQYESLIDDSKDSHTIEVLLFESDTFTFSDFNDQILSYGHNLLQSENPNLNYNKNNIHIVEKFYLTVEISQMLFSKESIKFLNERIIENWLNENFVKTFMKLNACKKWMLENVSLIDQHTFILWDEATMGTYGVRNINKIKCLTQIKSNDKIPFLKISNSSLKYDKLSLMYNRSYFWNGMKIMNLSGAIKYKLTRYELTDYMDFISIQEVHKLVRNIIINNKNIVEGQHNDVNNLLIRFLKYDKIKLHSLIKYNA